MAVAVAVAEAVAVLDGLEGEDLGFFFVLITGLIIACMEKGDR